MRLMPTRFIDIDIDMPEEFVLECLTADGSWIDWGLYRRRPVHLSAGAFPGRGLQPRD